MLVGRLVVSLHSCIVVGKTTHILGALLGPVVTQLSSELGCGPLDPHVEPGCAEVANLVALDLVHVTLGIIPRSFGLVACFLRGASLLPIAPRNNLPPVGGIVDGVVTSIPLVVEGVTVMVVASVQLADQGIDGGLEGAASSKRVLVRLGLGRLKQVDVFLD